MDDYEKIGESIKKNNFLPGFDIHSSYSNHFFFYRQGRRSRQTKGKSRVKIYVGNRIQKIKLKTESSVVLTKGKTYKPRLDIKPAKAANKKLQWTSSNTQP